MTTSEHLGPASYNTLNGSIALQSLKDAILSKTVKGGFGSTASRILNTRSKSAGDEVEPGPGHYEVKPVLAKKSEKSYR